MPRIFNKKNLNSIPSFSSNEVQQKASELDKMDDAELKSKSIAVINNAAENSSTKNVAAIARRPRLDGIEKHSIFERSERVWSSLKDSLEQWLGADCKESGKAKQPKYTKRIIVTKEEDIELKKQTCESAAGNIVCEKTLSVSCDSMQLNEILSHDGWVYNGDTITIKESISAPITFILANKQFIIELKLKFCSITPDASINRSQHLGYSPNNGSLPQRKDDIKVILNNKKILRRTIYYKVSRNVYQSKAGRGDNEWDEYTVIDEYIPSPSFKESLDIDLLPLVSNGTNVLEVVNTPKKITGILEATLFLKYCKQKEEWVERCWQE